MKKAIIAGGGLVGSLLAIFLRKRKIAVDVYEKRSDMRKANITAGKSINMACSNRAWRSLRLVGLEEEVKKISIPMKGRMMHPLDGECYFQPYGTKSEAIYSVSRGELNKILLEQAEKEGANIYFNQKCTDVDFPKNTISFSDTETDKTTTQKADVIFGADGAHSAVRESMRKKLRLNYTQTYIEHGYKELTIPPINQNKWAMEKNYLHIWPRKQYMLIALPNLDGSFTCTLFLAFKGETSFEKLQTKEEIRQFFQNSFPDAIKLMPNLIEQFFQNPTSSLMTISCAPWTFENKITLIGDAAHAIVPFYGQGMVSGFEDVRVLDDLLDENSVEMILEKYEEARKENTDAIRELALHNFIEMRDLVADSRFLLRKKIEAHIQKLYLGKYTPLYSMVTFSHIPYKEALQKGKNQRKMLDEILEIENIENIWQSKEFEIKIQYFIEKYGEDVLSNDINF